MSATQVENITIQVKANGTAKAEKQLNSLAETLDYIEATLSNIASIPDVIGALGEGIRNIGANATKSLGQITTIGKEAETASEKISTIGSNITPSPEIETIADDFTDIGEAAETASRQMSSVDAINFANAQSNIQMLERELEEAGQKLAELMNKPDSSSGAINGQIERVKRLSAQLNEARAKVSAVSGEFNYIDARAFAGTVSKVDILNRELESANRKLAELMNNPNSSNDQITQTVKKVQRLEEELKKAQREAKGTNLALSAMGKISDVFKKITGSLGTVIKSIARIAAYRAVRSMLKAITQGFTTGIQNLARYSDEFNNQMSRFSTYSLYLKNSLGALSEPLLNLLLPALERVINYFVKGVNHVNEFIAAINGETKYTVAVLPEEGSKNWIDYAKSIDASTASAKKLQNTLLGFDEINRLNGDTTDTTDYSSMFKEMTVSEKAVKNAQKLSKIFKDIKKFLNGKLGLNFGGLDNVLTNGISGEDIAKMVITAVCGLTGAVTGFILGGTTGSLIGRIVGISLGLIASGIFFDNNGKLDPNEIFYMVAAGLGLVAGAVIGAMTIGTVTAGAIGAIIGLAIGLAVGFADQAIINSGISTEKIQEIFDKICDILVGALLALGLAVAFVATGGTITIPLALIFAGTGATFAMLSPVTNIKEFFETLSEQARNGWDNGWNADPDASPAAKFILALLGSIASILGIASPSKEFKSMADFCLQGFSNGFSENWDSTISFITEKFDGFIEGVKTGLDDLKEKFENWSAKIKLPHFAWDSDGTEVTNAVVRKALEAMNLPTKIPKLSVEWYANGGYVDNGQLFIAREAGAELVGSMNGHTAVANNDQIEAGIEEAAYRGFMRAMSGNSGGGTTTIVAQLNGKTLFEEVVRQNKSATTTYGKSPLF